MSKIDVSQWKEFNIGKLFDFYRGKESAPKRVPDGDIPFISETRENNGMVKLASSEHIFPGKSITVSVNYASTVLYQEKDFCASVNIIVLHNDKLTVNVGLFLAAVISKLHQKYSYNDKVSAFKLKQENIKLPVDSSGEPDWQYMDSYIAKRAALAHKYVSELVKAKDKPKLKPLKINGWKEFKLTDLFNVKTGAYLSKHQLKPGSIPRVTVSSVNNGIVGSFERCGLSNERLFSNFLSVNFFGNVFYHDSLCSVDMKVHVLEPKHLYSKESMLFLAVVLRRKFIIDGYGTYGDQLSSSKLKKDMVYLPVDSSGHPDWHYMDEYIAKRSALSHKYVSELKSTKNQRGSR